MVSAASGCSCHRPPRISTRSPEGGRCASTPSSPWPAKAAGAAGVAATLQPVRAVADTWLHGEAARRRGSPVPYIKAWAGLLGMSGGPVRPLLGQVSRRPCGPRRRPGGSRPALRQRRQLVYRGQRQGRAPAAAAITSAGSWPRSCSSTIAALRPGAPVMEPPGWVDPPVWYRPGMGMRCEAQPGTGRSGAAACQPPVAAVEGAVHHVPVQPLVVGRRLHQLAEDHVVGEAGREGAQVCELPLGVLGLDPAPSPAMPAWNS